LVHDSPQGERSGLAEVLTQAWPASLTMLTPTITRFIDGVMVSHMGAQIGTDSLAAQSVSGILAFVPESFAMGVLTVVNTYVSQNLGAGRMRRCGQYVWAGLVLAVLGAVMIASTALLAGPLFAQMPHTPEVRRLEVIYFRYMVIGAFFSLPSRVVEQFFFGIHRPYVVFYASLVANGVNILGNYVLIYGKWGFPEMGLEGAAIASVLSWGIQLALLLYVFVSPGLHKRFATRFYQLLRWKHIRQILSIGYASGVQFCNDILSWSLFITYLVGQFGTAHLAASTIGMRYMSISFMPAVGINIATTAIVGKYIGMGRPDLARRRAHTALATAMVYMGICALAFLALGEPLVRAFVVQTGEAPALVEEIVRIGRLVLICAAVFQIFDALGIVYVGALRGAGDTRWPMVVTFILSWGLIIGGGWLAVKYFPDLTSIGPWIAASAYVIVLGLLLAWRFESGAWEKIDLLGRGKVSATPPPLPPAEGLPQAVPTPKPKE